VPEGMRIVAYRPLPDISFDRISNAKGSILSSRLLVGGRDGRQTDKTSALVQIMFEVFVFSGSFWGTIENGDGFLLQNI